MVLDREGWGANHKRVSRIYREEKLSLHLKRRRKRASAVRLPFPAGTRPNEVWALDFIHDRLTNGRSIKILAVVDEYSRKCLALEVNFGIGGRYVTGVLNRLIESYGNPQALLSDNGPEFASNDLDAWAYRHSIKLDFINPGKPNQNAIIESFNGRFREECLNDNQFRSLVEAQVVIKTWQEDYNEERPHGSLEGLTPSEFAKRYESMVKQEST